MKALDAALQYLAKASTALERHAAPTPRDVEEATAAAQTALRILKASSTLLDEGLFQVTDEPHSGTPLDFGGER